MKRTATEENGEAKRSYVVKQEGITFGYDTYITNYASTTSTPTTVNQPLPGQPPLPPMPPPSGAVPPPPHVFVPTQVNPIPTWTHAPPPWQWLTQQATALSSQTARDIATNFQRDLPLRGNFVRRERFNSCNNSNNNNNRNNMYNQRNNFHRNKNNRRTQRFESPQGGGGNQFDQSYFGAAAAAAAALPGNIGLDWQRNNFSATPNEGIMSHMNPVNIPNLMSHLKSGIVNRRTDDDSDVRIVPEDVMMKKNKQRKPMSQSYPSRPWNREDAERALKTESEYNKTIKAQSLIIKFPDPDLNKDIVREFHPGIQNIHFQSPSGPRYCFIQMADNVDIDKAIKELEKVAFGVGHLKVERKSLRDDDNPMPEEIDPYTLYIGNLPESVNVNEVKSKFPTAARVDVGYAQKMRNTRYAFIRYNSVDESISAYKEAHDLMWDTRSIIVRFRRQRGNTCLPGEQKNFKKVKEEAAAAAAKLEQKNSLKQKQDKENAEKQDNDSRRNKCDSTALSSATTAAATTTIIPPEKNTQNAWTSQSTVTVTSNISTSSTDQKEDMSTLLTEIKEEPQDYEEMDMQMENGDDDDDEEEEIEEDEEEEEEMNDNEEEEEEEEEEEDDDDDDDDEEVCLDNETVIGKSRERLEEEPMVMADVQSDHLDKMFSDLENIAGDISL